MYEEDRKKEIKRLLTWLSNTKNICITREQVEKIYFESTPEYSVKRILENVS
jgi:elongation factor P--beta-lysine ligase